MHMIDILGHHNTVCSTCNRQRLAVLYWNLRTAIVFALACSVRKNENSDVAISMNYDFTSFFSWSNSICNPEMAIMRDSRPSKTIATFWRWTPWAGIVKLAGTYLPQRRTLRCSIWLAKIYSGHPDTPIVIGWTTCSRVHQKSGARKVTHPSTDPALCGLTSEFPWDPA